MSSSPQSPQPGAGPKPYVRAVGPRLRVLLYIVFAIVALLGADSVYLASITAMEWATGNTYQNYFYQYMFLAHLALGLLLIAPFVVFGLTHMAKAHGRRNRRAVRIGYALFTVSVAVLVTGLLLMRVGAFNLRNPFARSTVYWLHVACPLVAAWLYWLHRLAGPRIKWRLGIAYGGVVAAACVAMLLMHTQDPRQWYQKGPVEGEKYFFPSLARTATGKFIPAEAMLNDQYCLQCHADIHAGWSNSAHRFSSFNNPAYLASVRQTREFSMKLDGNVKRSRWCAGCHDPAPFFSGAFDDPKFDDVNHPTANAGITCTVCHAITNVNSVRGNADYTIEEPLQYPFAYSNNEVLKWINRQLVKAKPSFHKKTFLKPFHKTAEFCSGCHKVHLPKELNDYKFLRGQNHYDPYLLSGVSGHGIRSFYYPPKAKKNCSSCHMPLKPSDDFGAKFFDDAQKLSVHDHLFPSANTGVAHFRDKPEVVKAHQDFLDGVMRVDIFGVREGGRIDGELIAPIRPRMPVLKPGGKYLIETVIRTLKMGHLFTQGTIDSNEVWLDVTVSSGGKVIGRSGGMDEHREVDPWAHFVNAFVIDKDGKRIDRRNAQDIFTKLYDHQIPPGAGQAVHYLLELPDALTAPVTVDVKLQYRKFDRQYMAFVKEAAKPGDKPFHGGEAPRDKPYVNDLPIITLAVDRVTFPVEGVGGDTPNNPMPKIFPWQRWNDYGIGLLLKGKAELRQAEAAFAAVEKLGRYDGPLNLARVYYQEGRLDEAAEAVKRAAAHYEPPPPRWTAAWLSGLINREQGRLDDAQRDLRSALYDRTPEMIERGFDFSFDYNVINLLGQTLFDQAKQLRTAADKPQAEALMRAAVDQFQRTLVIDPENVTAHYNLQLLYERLGDSAKAAEHQALHAKYKPDDNARGRASALARQRYPAANHAAEKVVINSLQRSGAPELPAPTNVTLNNPAGAASAANDTINGAANGGAR